MTTITIRVPTIRPGRLWAVIRAMWALLPANHSHVVALRCTTCAAWVKPRHYRIPANICRDCDAAGAIQTWKRST
jgi:hypothetical protein